MPGLVCPNGHEVKVVASFCPICGAPLPVIAPTQTEPGGTHCPNGHVFTYKAAFCPTCGAPMYTPLKKPRSTMEQVAIGIGVLLFLCVIVFIASNGKPSNEWAQQFGNTIGRLIAPAFAACIVAYPLRLLILWILQSRKPPILVTRRTGWYMFIGIAIVFTIVFSIRIYIHGSLF